RPKRSVRMLGSAVFVLPWRSRLGLNVDPLPGLAALAGLVELAAAAAGPSSVSGSRPRAATATTPTIRRMTLILKAPLLLSAEVVAADTVDLERHVVGFRLGVRQRALLMRRGEGITAHLFQQIRSGRTANVGYLDG